MRCEARLLLSSASDAPFSTGTPESSAQWTKLNKATQYLRYSIFAIISMRCDAMRCDRMRLGSVVYLDPQPKPSATATATVTAIAIMSDRIE